MSGEQKAYQALNEVVFEAAGVGGNPSLLLRWIELQNDLGRERMPWHSLQSVFGVCRNTLRGWCRKLTLAGRLHVIEDRVTSGWRQRANAFIAVRPSCAASRAAGERRRQAHAADKLERDRYYAAKNRAWKLRRQAVLDRLVNEQVRHKVSAELKALLYGTTSAMGSVFVDPQAELNIETLETSVTSQSGREDWNRLKLPVETPHWR